MKRISLLFFISYFIFSNAVAQTPSWGKKAAQAVFTLKTFKADGSLLGSSTGFFVSEDGEAVSSFSPFKGAQRAIVIDAQGKEWPVDCIIGANDMYDVAKFLVSAKRPATLPLGNAAVGANVWLLPYTTKKEPACLRGNISQSEKFQESYDYYTISIQANEQFLSSPIVNEQGEVIGLLQPSAGDQGSSSYAVSARFVADLKTSGLSLNDPTLRSTNIRKALPNTYDEALLALYMSASVLAPTQYNDYLERFILKFPNGADGYIYRARLLTAKGQFASADEDMQHALKVADKKDDVHYQYALLIYLKEVANTEPYEGWNLQRALEESQAAYDLNPLPIYRQQQAQILFAQQKYDEAFNIYDELSKGAMRTADTFYAAAQCKLEQDDKRSALILIDSAVNMFTRPYVKTASPYLLARARLSMEVRRFQQAINDMRDLMVLEPNDAELWAEKASYELRVNLLEEAMESAQQCQRLDAANSDIYLIMGIVQCIKGDKAQGMPNLLKAKELGNSQAQSFIDKYAG